MQDDQTARDEEIARSVQAELDAQDAQRTAAADANQAGDLPELGEDDDVALQQTLLLSRQQAQSQGSDPHAASSAGTRQSTEQERQRELQVGLEYQAEVQSLQIKWTQGSLNPNDVARYRTVSQLWSDNQTRVAEQFDRQVQENTSQQSQSTRAILGSLQPLNRSKAKESTVKPPPATGTSITPIPDKQGGVTGTRKAPPPILGLSKPAPVKALPQGPPVGPPKRRDSGAKSALPLGGPEAPIAPLAYFAGILAGVDFAPIGSVADVDFPVATSA